MRWINRIAQIIITLLFGSLDGLAALGFTVN